MSKRATRKAADSRIARDKRTDDTPQRRQESLGLRHIASHPPPGELQAMADEGAEIPPAQVRRFGIKINREK